MKIPENRNVKSSTLCYIEKDGCYLMMHRVIKENDVNHDKWIGVGGHFEEGETADECLVREIREETGIGIASYRYRGLITFVPHEGSIELMHLYTGDLEGADLSLSIVKEAGADAEDRVNGNEIVMDEGVLEWIPKEKIWDLELWEGDKIFFRLIEEDRDFENMLLAYDENDQLCAAELEGEELELFDVLNDDGTRSGVVAERGVVHKRGVLHGTVHIWVLRENEDGRYDVLIQKRSQQKDSNPGCYDISAAGHIKSGGTVIDAAIRETEEEIGIRTEEKEFEFVGIHHGFYQDMFHGREFRDNEMMHVFILNREVKDEEIVLQESEVESVLWMDIAELFEILRREKLKHCIYEEEVEMVAEHLNISIN